MPDTNDISTPSQNMLLLHTAAELAEKPEVFTCDAHTSMSFFFVCILLLKCFRHAHLVS